MVCKRNNFLITHIASTTIQNCILKIQSAALMSALHKTALDTWQGQWCSYSVLSPILPCIKMARFSLMSNSAQLATQRCTRTKGGGGGGRKRNQLGHAHKASHSSAKLGRMTLLVQTTTSYTASCMKQTCSIFEVLVEINASAIQTCIPVFIQHKNERKKIKKTQQGRTRQWFIHTLEPGICCPMS